MDTERKMRWVAMLVTGNSLSIGGHSFKLNDPKPIPVDLVNLLKKHYAKMFKIWQHPADEPIPRPGISTQAAKSQVTTADMRPRSLMDDSQSQAAKNFIVHAVDVQETVEVAGTETSPDSWPDATDECATPQDEPAVEEFPEDASVEETVEEAPEVNNENEFTGEGAPQVKTNRITVPKKKKGR